MGGEQAGHFAVIRLEGRTADVDAPLPLDYWQDHDSTPHAANVKVERIGEEIVNSISIHQIQDEEAHLYDIVAVLTNNDKTVRTFSLSQGIETSVLDFPFPINHATISPNGKMMAVVGDMNRAFFFRRALDKEPPQIPKPHNRLSMCSANWKPAGETVLHIPDPWEPRVNTGYFTTAWSPNGQLMAVGSEAGHITVFDMNLAEELDYEDMDSVKLVTIPSSRPNIAIHMHPGAVRSMLFSPEPWDLLIWAEDQGRICVGDLRTGLRRRQVIELDPKNEKVQKLDIEDVPSGDGLPDPTRLLEMEAELLRRRVRDREDGPHSSLESEFIDAHMRARNRRHNRVNSPYIGVRNGLVVEDDPHGLTAHEQQILESLRTTRQREETRAGGGTPHSVNYTTPSLFQSQRPMRASHDRNRSISNSVNRASDYDSFPELSRTSQRTPPPGRDQDVSSLPPLHAIQEYLMLRDRQSRHDDEEPGIRADAPNSMDPAIALPSLTSNGTRSSIPPHAQRANDTSLPSSDDQSPWRTISNAMSLARGPLFESANRETERDRDGANLEMLGRQRERLRQLHRTFEANNNTTDNPRSVTGRYELLRDATASMRGFQDGYDVLRRRAIRPIVGSSTASGPEIAVRTAGLAISKDGSTVWAATEEGVFEIKLAVKSRMIWPALDLR